MTYEFELPFPPSVNTYYRNVDGKMLISKEGRVYRKSVASMIKGLPMLVGELHVSSTLYPPCKRRRDLDNFDGKALWDALTKAGVWKDDSQVKSRYSEWGEVVKGGKVFVTISKRH
ncbi:MAG: RusA family crossover junction endodeoxyribonuclease [Candidatus Bathyarchaeia archaeon]